MSLRNQLGWNRLGCGVVRYAAALAVAVSVSLPLGAHAEEGWFVGAGAARVDIGGDMDGQSVVTDGTSINVLPKQNPAIGYELLVGYRARLFSLALGTTRTEHSGEWLGATSSTDFSSYNLDFKYYFRSQSRIQPLAILGVGFTYVTVKDGSSDGVSVEDANYKGIDGRFGGGVEVVIYKHVALDLQGVYRYGSYNGVDGVTSDRIKGGVNGDGLTASAIAKLTF